MYKACTMSSIFFHEDYFWLYQGSLHAKKMKDAGVQSHEKLKLAAKLTKVIPSALDIDPLFLQPHHYRLACHHYRGISFASLSVIKIFITLL